jgi:hypothetical protein
MGYLGLRKITTSIPGDTILLDEAGERMFNLVGECCEFPLNNLAYGVLLTD